MIEISNPVIEMEAAISGMRNAKKSWEKSDSISCFCNLEQFNKYCLNRALQTKCPPNQVKNKVAWYKDNAILDARCFDPTTKPMFKAFFLGENDLKLAKTLSKAGTDHGKFLRQITVSFNITAPLYWWKEFDTYKVGTTANSTSTMHTLSNEKITIDCFSFDGVLNRKDPDWTKDLIEIINLCEKTRQKYLKTKDKAYWRRLIQMLPSAWMQERTITLNYAVLKNMYNARKNHKLTEWQTFCAFIEKLPYAKELILCED